MKYIHAFGICLCDIFINSSVLPISQAGKSEVTFLPDL